MNSRRWLLLAVCVLAHPAMAQDPDEGTSIWTTLPSQPTTRDFVQLRNFVTGCSLTEGVEVDIDHAAHEIHVYVGAGDLCSYGGTTTIVPIGTLAAGHWQVLRYSCLAQDFSICSPDVATDLSFLVIEAGRPRHVIPTLGDTVKLALCAVLALAGMGLLRARR